MRGGLAKFIFIVIAIACIVGAGLLQRPLDEQREEFELVPPGNVVAESHPGYTLLTIAPGGLRAPIVNYLWIRAEKLKQDGRHHEAMQLADMICQLMPRFPGVWAFHAWNLAWNISVTTQTPEERWLWVYNGVKLLRDKGIPMNPKSMALYKELGWIFFSKMGQTTDEMHRVYKQRWAKKMQDLLASPPYGDTADVIDAIRPIVKAPLDKDPRRQGRDEIQPDKRQQLLQDTDVAEYAAALQKLNINIDRSFLDAYNGYTKDRAVAITRVQPPRLESDHEKQVSELINDSKHETAREKILAFLRAQILWNQYKMDPDWMLHMMEKYDAPFDWRTVQSQGLYWVTYGLETCGDIEAARGEALNIDRIVLNNLKALTWNGRLTYTQNPRNALYPQLNWSSDWRFIKPTHEMHIEYGKRIAKMQDETFDENKFRSGHVNYLAAAVNMLYAGGRRQRARKYFEWLKDNYDLKKDIWKLPLNEWVIARLNKDGRPIQDLARNQLSASLTAAYEHYAMGDVETYRQSLQYAKRVYDVYQEGTPERNKLAPLPHIIANIASVMLVRPETAGIHLGVVERHRIYDSLDPRIQVMLYDRVEPFLRRMCENAEPKIDFDKAFPKPSGLEEFRQQQRRRFEQQNS